MTASAIPGLERNAVVAASAGTGKTQLLTSIYLGHALGLGARRVPAHRIVATTFSRAAAAEIRERLEQRLTSLVELGAAPEHPRALGPDLAELAARRGLGQSELAARAREALDELPYATIDTLHGLAANVLRQYAVELGLLPNFAILDEQQAFEDAERTIDDVLSTCLEEGSALRDGATALLDACLGLESTRSSVVMLLERLDEEGLDASALAGGGELAERERTLTDLGALCEAVLAAGQSPFSAAASAVLRLLARPELDVEALRDALLQIASVRATPKVKELAAWPLIDEFLGRFGRSRAPRAERVHALIDLVQLAPRLERVTADVIEVLDRVQRELRERRRKRGALAFSDLLRIARDGLRDHPEIARRAGAGIELLLVDEFQDTSRVQRDLLLLLRERPERCRERKPGTVPEPRDVSPSGLVVVGDRKQSIYAFRGAEVSVFARLAAELAGAPAAEALFLRGVTPNPEPVAEFRTLTDNYRSGAAILDAVNVIATEDFDTAPTRSFQIRYMEAEALRVPSARAGESGQVTLIRDDGDTSGLPPLLALARPAQRAAFVAAGFCAESARQGTRFGDLAILARRRATLPLVEVALDRLGVPFVVAGRELYATPEVRDLLALLRLAVSPRDRHALAVAARGPLGGLSDATLVELSEPGRGLLPAEQWATRPITDAEEAPLVRQLAERLIDFTRTAPLISPRDALALALRSFELEQVYSALPRGQIRLGNVERLTEIAARHGGNLAAFVRWLERQVALEVDEAEAAVFSEEDDAVRLLTIHASKGLAFPVVVVLDTSSPEATSNTALGLLRSDDEPTRLVLRHRGAHGPIRTPVLRRFQDDLGARARAERQRLSYVALTRAERELAIVLPADGARDHTLARSIQRVLEAGKLGGPGVRELSAHALLGATELAAETRAEPPLPPPRRPEAPRVATAAIGTTALADFRACARRFRLLHLEGLEEPALFELDGEDGAEHDPRALGSAAHRVLERWPLAEFGRAVDLEQVLEALAREGLAADDEETRRTARGIASFLAGDLARSVHEPGARVYREHDLIFEVNAAPSEPQPEVKHAPRQLELFAPRARAAPAPATRTFVKATLDLLILHADGRADVVDYKRSRGGDAARYAFQLAAYAAAVKAEFRASRIRTGLVHLLGAAETPEWIEPEALDLDVIVRELVAARTTGNFPPLAARAACRSLRCGFVNACHPARASGQKAHGLA